MSEQDFYELKGKHEALRDRVDRMEATAEKKWLDIDGKLDLLLNKFSEAKGGWKVLGLIIPAAVTLGALLTKFLTITIK